LFTIPQRTDKEVEFGNPGAARFRMQTAICTL
jgi:hypothetical protein